METEIWEQDGDRFCMQVTGTDNARYFELSEARPAPSSWSETLHASVFLPGQAAVTVKVYHPDEEKPPSVYFATEQELPFEVLQRFVELVATSLQDATSTGHNPARA